LHRQIRRHFGGLKRVPAEIREFFDLVDDAYRGFDTDRTMLERSLELSSEELLQANAELRAVFQEVPDLFIWFDADGVAQRVERGRSLLHYPEPDELAGIKPFFDARRRCHERRVPEIVELTLESARGRQFYEARLLPLLGDQVLAVVRNITERRRGELALAEEKERLDITLRSIGDGVVTADRRTRIQVINRAALRLAGLSRDAAIGRRLEQVLTLESHAPGAILERLDHVINTRQAWQESEVPLRSTAGRVHTVDLRAAPIEDGAAVVGVAVVFRDVSERVRLVEERLRASKLESLGILAGGIAHDFNNILQALLGSISLAEFRIVRGRDISGLLAKARRASLRARDLTKQLLAVSRGGAPVKKPASIAELLRESSTFASRGTNVRCELQIAPDLAPVNVDQGQISQVIHNLVINAAQAMPDGGVIEVGAENLADEIRIYVRDRGVGIPRSVRTKIFDPYFTTKPTGSGLGLYTAYVIVRRHDGRIAVESEVGAGTTFAIHLPISTAEPEADPSDPPGVTGGRGRVLVMDDESEVLTITREMLQHLGYTVEIAREGHEATELFRAACGNGGAGFEFAMLDLTIAGGQGGGETVGALRVIDPGILAVAMTGYANDDIVVNYRENGFDAVLVKPFSVIELDRTLRILSDAAAQAS
jgi:PAS domain S-box-containing protein